MKNTKQTWGWTLPKNKSLIKINYIRRELFFKWKGKKCWGLHFWGVAETERSVRATGKPWPHLAYAIFVKLLFQLLSYHSITVMITVLKCIELISLQLMFPYFPRINWSKKISFFVYVLVCVNFLVWLSNMPGIIIDTANTESGESLTWSNYLRFQRKP